MKTVQLKKHKNSDWKYLSENINLKEPLVLVFGNRYLLEDKGIYEEIKGFLKTDILYLVLLVVISLQNLLMMKQSLLQL